MGEITIDSLKAKVDAAYAGYERELDAASRLLYLTYAIESISRVVSAWDSYKYANQQLINAYVIINNIKTVDTADNKDNTDKGDR